MQITNPTAKPRIVNRIMNGGMYPNRATYSAPSVREIHNGRGLLNPNKFTMTDIT